MHLTTRNVNSAFRELVRGIDVGSRLGSDPTVCLAELEEYGGFSVRREQSRNGPVLVVDEPVLITYTHPLERVLFNAARDANPFSLLYESLWMLTGRNDVAPLCYFTPRFIDYSDDGVILNDAYGYRWRNHTHYDIADNPEDDTTGIKTDQLDVIVAHLKADPHSRRAVLSMWGVENDLLKIGGTGNRMRCKKCCGTGGINTGPPQPDDGVSSDVWVKCDACEGSSWVNEPGSKGVCCNLNVMFSLRADLVCPTCSGTWTEKRAKELDEQPPSEGGVCPNCGGDAKNIYLPRRWLDMTVTNRSNDLIWGLLGANYCTFTVLQEYMTARLGVEVGLYHHFTNNLHCYTESNSGFHPEKWLADKQHDLYEFGITPGNEKPDGGNIYERRLIKTVPLVRNAHLFDVEAKRFVDRNYANGPDWRPQSWVWEERFLRTVAQPIMDAWHFHKAEQYKADNKGLLLALERLKDVEADDWRVVCTNWIQRRLAKRGPRREQRLPS